VCDGECKFSVTLRNRDFNYFYIWFNLYTSPNLNIHANTQKRPRPHPVLPQMNADTPESAVVTVQPPTPQAEGLSTVVVVQLPSSPSTWVAAPMTARTQALKRLRAARKAVATADLVARKEACAWAWSQMTEEERTHLKAGRLSGSGQATRVPVRVTKCLEWGHFLAGILEIPLSDPKLELLEAVTTLQGYQAWAKTHREATNMRMLDKYATPFARFLWFDDTGGSGRVALWVARVGVTCFAMLEELRVAVAGLKKAALTFDHVSSFKAVSEERALVAAQGAVDDMLNDSSDQEPVEVASDADAVEVTSDAEASAAMLSLTEEPRARRHPRAQGLPRPSPVAGKKKRKGDPAQATPPATPPRLTKKPKLAERPRDRRRPQTSLVQEVTPSHHTRVHARTHARIHPHPGLRTLTPLVPTQLYDGAQTPGVLTAQTAAEYDDAVAKLSRSAYMRFVFAEAQRMSDVLDLQSKADKADVAKAATGGRCLEVRPSAEITINSGVVAPAAASVQYGLFLVAGGGAVQTGALLASASPGSKFVLAEVAAGTLRRSPGAPVGTYHVPTEAFQPRLREQHGLCLALEVRGDADVSRANFAPDAGRANASFAADTRTFTVGHALPGSLDPGQLIVSEAQAVPHLVLRWTGAALPAWAETEVFTPYIDRSEEFPSVPTAAAARKRFGACGARGWANRVDVVLCTEGRATAALNAPGYNYNNDVLHGERSKGPDSPAWQQSLHDHHGARVLSLEREDPLVRQAAEDIRVWAQGAMLSGALGPGDAVGAQGKKRAGTRWILSTSVEHMLRHINAKGKQGTGSRGWVPPDRIPPRIWAALRLVLAAGAARSGLRGMPTELELLLRAGGGGGVHGDGRTGMNQLTLPLPAYTTCMTKSVEMLDYIPAGAQSARPLYDHAQLAATFVDSPDTGFSEMVTHLLARGEWGATGGATTWAYRGWDLAWLDFVVFDGMYPHRSPPGEKGLLLFASWPTTTAPVVQFSDVERVTFKSLLEGQVPGF
jgi:hypothetical protein